MPSSEARPHGSLPHRQEVPVFFRSKLSPHQVSICDVLASLEFAGDPPKDLVLIGCEPLSLELGTELTPTVAAKVPEMVAAAVGQLAARGLHLSPRKVAVGEKCDVPRHPLGILEIDDLMAVVDTAGERRRVSLMLMHEAVAVGDYVLIQQGSFAYERVDAERARESLALMEEVFAQGAADVRAW